MISLQEPFSVNHSIPRLLCSLKIPSTIEFFAVESYIVSNFTLKRCFVDKLFIETENGRIELDDEIIKKYKIKPGTRSPFKGYRIIGANGEYKNEEKANADLSDNKDHNPDEEDGLVEMDNDIVLSTSEMLDIAEGTDSNI